MKKIVAFGLVAAVGVTMAFASSIGVPWFVDNAPVAAGIPPTTNTLTLIFLHNNTNVDVVCDITYFSEQGQQLVPTPINTFNIPANSSMAFRPVAADPSGAVTQDAFGNPVTGDPFGQEGPVGFVVPDRPRDVDTKKNGSCVISWTGAPNDIQGQVTAIQTAPAGFQGNRLNNNQPLVVSYAHLLPPGA